MKTEHATVKLVQLTTANKQGLYPIVIRAQWNGRCEKRTGISLTKKDWSAKEMIIKKSYPNSTALNKQLQDKLQVVVDKKNYYEENNLDFKVEDLFIEDFTSINKLDYHTIQESMLNNKHDSYCTRLAYSVAEKRIYEYLNRQQVNINELDSDTCISFSKYLKSQGLKNSTIFNLLARIASVWNYAIDHDLVDIKKYPFKNFKLHQHFRSDFKKKAITKEEFTQIRDMLLDRLVNSDKQLFLKKGSDEFVLAMYVLGYYFGGLALIDMVKLKKSQIETKQIKRSKYYIFNNVRRSKTNQPVPIIIEYNIITKPLMEIYLNSEGEYLFPILQGGEDQKHIRMLVEMATKQINLKLRRLTGLDITYYSCRHSFATHYINTKGANPINLATLMGRSVDGIFGYVKSISTEEEIIKERERMDL